MALGNKSLSLAMIVKDEESCISRCLESVIDLADEMIIVDTGSTDKTVDICKSYNAQVFFYPWNNDFASARNFGLDRVTGDWVLWLDADEEVSGENRDLLDGQTLFEENDALSVPLINFYGKQADRDEVMYIAQPRFFRNHLGFRFENKIHEWLNLSAAYEQERVGFLELEIFHYGYMDSLIADKQKFSRNVKMLLEELKEDKSHSWTHYYLAAEYNRRKEYSKAFEHINQSIRLFLNEGIIPPPSMLYSLKYSILIETGSFDGAWPGIKSAVKMFPDYVDLKFYMGVILFYKKMYREALGCFKECLEMGETKVNYLSIRGLGSFRAWYYVGQCQEGLEIHDDAFAAYLQALMGSKNFAPAREALVDLINKMPLNFAARIKYLKPEYKKLLLDVLK